MVRCITSHQLWEQYGQTTFGVVDHSKSKWCLLGSSLDNISPVDTGSLLFYLENIRTFVGTINRLCFHLAESFLRTFVVNTGYN